MPYILGKSAKVVILLCLFCCRSSYLNICVAYCAVIQFLKLLGPDVPSETLRFLMRPRLHIRCNEVIFSGELITLLLSFKKP